jgi:hypothetical protein
MRFSHLPILAHKAAEIYAPSLERDRSANAGTMALLALGAVGVLGTVTNRRRE